MPQLKAPLQEGLFAGTVVVTLEERLEIIKHSVISRVENS